MKRLMFIAALAGLLVGCSSSVGGIPAPTMQDTLYILTHSPEIWRPVLALSAWIALGVIAFSVLGRKQ